MGFYIRKAVSVGPLRFNLSKSGIGMSTGVRGLRLGAGPRGNYVHMGRHGVYFRQTLPPSGRAPSHPSPLPTPPSVPATVGSVSVGEFEEIDSGTVSAMTDGSSAALLSELNEKRQRRRLVPLVALVGILGTLGLWSAQGTWAGLAATIVTGLSLWLASARDTLRKTTVILYDLEPDIASAFEGLHDAFVQLQACGGKWHVGARADVRDGKYHAGASNLVRRSAISINAGQPPLVQCNIDAPLLPVGKQTLAFMPDRLLVFDAGGVGAVSYEDLTCKRTDTQFIESESVPVDTQVVGKTWRYVNKRGGPDKRFKDNRELPICAYEELRFSSASGLNELLQVSRQTAAEPVVAALAAMRRLSFAEVSPSTATSAHDK